MEEKYHFDEDGQLVLSDSFLNEIQQETEKLLIANPKVKKVFTIAVEGKAYDTKPLYIAYFKQPDL